MNIREGSRWSNQDKNLLGQLVKFPYKLQAPQNMYVRATITQQDPVQAQAGTLSQQGIMQQESH